MKKLVENMEKQIKNQEEEMERLKSKILNSLEEEMTTENLNKACILFGREQKKINELRAKLEVMYAIEETNKQA